MLENLFTMMMGRPKNRTSTSGSTQQHDQSGTSTSGPSQMNGPFSSPALTMPQPPNLPYPAAPYPTDPNVATPYYPSLPFSQPPSIPGGYKSDTGGSAQPYNYPTGTMARQVSPLDSVPFEAKVTLYNSTNLVSLDHLFKEINKAADVVDRADSYLKSSQSDYDFKTEQTLICQ